MLDILCLTLRTHHCEYWPSKNLKMARKILTVVGLLALFTAAFAVRLAPYHQVFSRKPFADGSRISLYGTDPHYHVRRIMLTMRTFPRVQEYDSYFGYPGGGQIYWPPVFDWTIAGAAKLLGYSPDGEESLLRFLVFIPPVLGAFTVVLAFFLARRFMDDASAWASSAIFALMPGHVSYSLLSRVDHHVGEMLGVVAMFLVFVIGLKEIEKRGRASLPRAILCGATMACALATSLGSLIFILLIAAFAVLAAIAQAAKPGAASPVPLLRFTWLAFLAAMVLLVPFCYGPPWLGPGHETYLGLSWSHLYVLGVVAGILFIMERVCCVARQGWQAAGLVGTAGIGLFALAAAIPVVAFPSLLAPFGVVGGYFTKADPWLQLLSEGQPLLSDRGVFRPEYGQVMLTRFVFLYPVFVVFLFVVWLRAKERPATFDFFLFWSAAMIPLGFSKKRMVYFLALNVSLAMGYLLVRLVRWLRKPPEGGYYRLRIPAAGVVAVCCIFACYPSFRFYRPDTGAKGEANLLFYSAPAEVRETFAWMRDHTPETKFYIAPTQTPDYGVLYAGDSAPWLLSYARRPTVGTFWGVFRFDGSDHAADVYRFFLAESEEEANEVCDRDKVRYVVAAPLLFTVREYAAIAGLDPDRYMALTYKPGTGTPVFQPTEQYPRLIGQRLYENDGLGGGADQSFGLQHYRLLYESEQFTDVFTGQSSSLKVFKYVKGASITGRTVPRADVRAELEIETNRGRKLTYRALAQANDEGGFALVVPYATGPSPGTHAISNYRVNSLAMDVSANVTDEDVIKGQEVKVAFPHR